jgi:hypothetical protein
MRRLTWIVTAAALAWCPGAAAQHFDIQPKTVAGRIGTDAFDDSISATVAEDVRVFGYDFQEDPFDPYFINDPGFNALAGALPPGSSFGFNLLSDLLYWDGTGAVALGPVADGESLTLAFGSSSRTAATGTGGQAGFFFGGPVTASGSFHRHLSSTLDGGAGLADPREGIYLVELELTSSVLAPSASVWIVYNNGLSEELHDQAIDHVAAAVIPEPGTWLLGLWALAAAVWGVRRRNGGGGAPTAG